MKHHPVSPIIISHRAPVSPSINIKKYITSFSQNLKFNSVIHKEWASFLEMNDSPEISPSLLWETGKAVKRSRIIS